MRKAYFATDGSYGNAKNIIIVDTKDWNDDVWDLINQMRDDQRYRFVKKYLKHDRFEDFETNTIAFSNLEGTK